MFSKEYCYEMFGRDFRIYHCTPPSPGVYNDTKDPFIIRSADTYPIYTRTDREPARGNQRLGGLLA